VIVIEELRETEIEEIRAGAMIGGVVLREAGAAAVATTIAVTETGIEIETAGAIVIPGVDPGIEIEIDPGIEVGIAAHRVRSRK
jgi:hypothetical protein